MAECCNGGTRFVAGRIVEQDRLVILFRWMQRPEVFGAIYDLTDYRSTFGTATLTSSQATS
jgi:hypothetical protein